MDIKNIRVYRNTETLLRLRATINKEKVQMQINKETKVGVYVYEDTRERLKIKTMSDAEIAFVIKEVSVNVK